MNVLENLKGWRENLGWEREKKWEKYMVVDAKPQWMVAQASPHWVRDAETFQTSLTKVKFGGWMDLHVSLEWRGSCPHTGVYVAHANKVFLKLYLINIIHNNTLEYPWNLQ